MRAELLGLLASEWVADAEALASDGQYWRNVYGGARAFACFRLAPLSFAIVRLLCTLATLTMLVLSLRGSLVLHASGVSPSWMLYFGSWTLVLQSLYFSLASVLTLTAICVGNRGISRTTPFVVRVTELAYGALLPAAYVHALVAVLVEWAHKDDCVSYAAIHAAAPTADPRRDAIYALARLLVVIVDKTLNRQPYYSSVHGLLGMGFCWAWLAFSLVWQLLGQKNALGQPYIYRCLDWARPLIGSEQNIENVTGKLLILNLFVVIPLGNYIYWLILWARRRAHALANSMRPPSEVENKRLFEPVSDYRDLLLDGRHWRAQFGGSSSAKTPKLGAYRCFGPRGYPIFRLLLLLLSLSIVHLNFFGDTMPPSIPKAKSLLYFHNWVLLLSSFYFLLAFLLTSFAACFRSTEARSAPLLVWLTWACYGMLLPAAFTNAISYGLVLGGHLPMPPALAHLIGPYDALAIDLVRIVGTLLLVVLDAWLNRQPYYACFHGAFGVLFIWGYVLFNLLYVGLGGTDINGASYIYPQWEFATPRSLGSLVTPGRLTLLEAFAVLPMVSMLYWCMLWARRRARVAAKSMAM